MIIDILNQVLAEAGLRPVEGETADKFRKFSTLLCEKNKVLNLTAIEEPDFIAKRHFADSIMLFKEDLQGGKLIDVGCGGGFPGIPVKLYADMLGIPLDCTLLDSTAKKIAFVNEAVDALSLSGIRGVAGRAEEEILKLGRESFDIGTARAVSDMRIISELVLPFLKVGGVFYAWKTEKAIPEVEEAKKTVEILGARYAGRVEYSPFFLQKCVKNAHTPEKYPRKYAQIVKKKLG